MKTIALCLNIPEVEANELQDFSWVKKYPGSGWIPEFVKLAHDKGYAVASGEGAYEQSLWDKDVVVIQEELNYLGLTLVDAGLKPSLLMCLESPIFTPHFYDRIDGQKKQFKAQMLFQGGTHQVYFPSFDPVTLKAPMPWNDRLMLVMVCANKHYSQLRDYMGSPALKAALETQLHDLRYQAISHFKAKGQLDLFGKGWPEMIAQPCDDKIETIRNYKFALCFENGAYPGYVTEKIIDCFAAGVIPIYYGAPDIYDFVPFGSLVSARKFQDFDSLYQHIATMAEDDARLMIEKGQEFLRSPYGLRHSYKGFAQTVMGIIDEN